MWPVCAFWEPCSTCSDMSPGVMFQAVSARSTLAVVGLVGALLGIALAAGGLTSFYLLTSLLACAFIVADFRVGVVALILLMPLAGSSTMFPHDMFGMKGLNPLNLLLAGTLASYLIHALADGSLRRFLPRPLLWLYVVPILIAGVIGARHVGEIAPALPIMYPDLEFPDAVSYFRDVVLKPMLTVLFALLVAAAAAKSEKPERFLLPAVAAICAMAAIELIYVVHSGAALSELASSDSREFLSTLGMHANDLGRLYAFAFALALFTWADAEERGLKLMLLAAIALTVSALILTFSRGAYVAMVVASALYVLWRFNTRTLIVAGLVAAAALVLLPEAVYTRLDTGQGEGLDAISAGRVNGLWLPLLPEVLHHPLFGNGIGSILWSEPMRRGAGETVLAVTHPHNAYLQAALDMGIVGLVLLCAYFAHVWNGLRTLAKDPTLLPALRGFHQGAAAGLLGMLVANLTDSSLAPRPEQVFLWLAIGMMYGERVRRAAAARAMSPPEEADRS
jgi:O-Antigen ligase